jgi:iron complex outermembrane receptor protein
MLKHAARHAVAQYSLVALAAMSFAAAAQDATPATAAENAGDATTPVQLDRIVVTARRRDETLQRVPMSVTALDAADLQTRGAHDLGALGAAVPNLTIYAGRGITTGTITAYIRGVGQSDTRWGVEPGVGVYVDDVYLARPQAGLLDILDVDRIEVLRGPQGTLYGRNTLGGAIKYVTHRIDDEFSGNVGMTVGNYARHDFNGAVNVPLGERLRTRVAFGSFDRGGFGRNLITGEDVSAEDVTVARVTADWLPSDAVDVRFAYDRYRDRSGVRGAKRLIVNPFDPLPPNDNNFAVQNGMPNVDQADTESASATVDWEISTHWRFKSITAHREGSSHGNTDFDTLPLPIIDLSRRLFDKQLSQEFQLHWDTARAHAIGGLYYLDGEAGGQGYLNILGRSFGGSGGVVETRGAALYGDLGLDLSDKLSVDAGLRYTSERKTATVLSQGYTDATFATPNGMVMADFTAAKTFNSLMPRINVSYQLTQDAMFYAQVSRGFKSGGYNIDADTSVAPQSALPFDPETVTSYELGAKTQWLGGQFTFNAALFHNDYRDIQLSVTTSFDRNGDGIDDGFFDDFTNAGAGTIDGAELELSAQTGKHLKWLGHAGYLDTKYDKFISADVNIASGQRFADAPRWTSGVSAIADIPLSSAGSLVARIDGNYQSKVYPTPDLNEAIARDGYALWNASLTWRSPTWQVALLGQNLTDKEYRVTGWDVSGLGIVTGFYGQPRTISLSLTYYF